MTFKLLGRNSLVHLAPGTGLRSPLRQHVTAYHSARRRNFHVASGVPVSADGHHSGSNLLAHLQLQFSLCGFKSSRSLSVFIYSHLLKWALQHRHIQRQQEQLNRLEVQCKVGSWLWVSESSALPGPCGGERRAPCQAASEACQGLSKVAKGFGEDQDSTDRQTGTYYIVRTSELVHKLRPVLRTEPSIS